MFDKNNWLNFVIGLLGFYFVFNVVDWLMGKYGTKMVASTTHLPNNYLWIVTFAVALIFTLILIIFFCKPRAPIFVCIAILIGAVLSMFNSLYGTILNLDKYFHKEGISAVQYLLPHLVVLAGALIALYISWASNKLSKD